MASLFMGAFTGEAAKESVGDVTGTQRETFDENMFDGTV
jgi:hypothetical protein